MECIMKTLSVIGLTFFLVGCKPEVKKERRVTSNTYTEPSVSYGAVSTEYEFKFVATEHNTFECYSDMGENRYKSKSEDGSVVTIRNGIITIVDPGDVRWTLINAKCLFVEREGWK